MGYHAPMTHVFGCTRTLLACGIGITSVGCFSLLPLIEGTNCYYLPGLTLKASAKQAKLGEMVQVEAIETIETTSDGCPRLEKVTFLLEDQTIAEDNSAPFVMNWTLDANVSPVLNQSQYDAPIFARSEYLIQGKKLTFVAGPLFVGVR